MRFERRYTQAGKSPFEGMAFRAADSEIRNPDGSIVFQLKDVDVPTEWSQVAADVLAQKYFRRAGVPARMVRFALSLSQRRAGLRRIRSAQQRR